MRGGWLLKLINDLSKPPTRFLRYAKKVIIDDPMETAKVRGCAVSLTWQYCTNNPEGVFPRSHLHLPKQSLLHRSVQSWIDNLFGWIDCLTIWWFYYPLNRLLINWRFWPQPSCFATCWVSNERTSFSLRPIAFTEKELSRVQWLALVLLVIGQPIWWSIPKDKGDRSQHSPVPVRTTGPAVQIGPESPDRFHRRLHHVLHLLLCRSFLTKTLFVIPNYFAGVYLELVLKQSSVSLFVSSVISCF